jgi:8-oxo-dGTP pyrophosphatase MutT (NUDIX family)
MAVRLFHVGIKALVTNKAGKILLVELPAWRDRPSYWDMPGGRMDEGESFQETLNRELQEEINCQYVGEPEIVGTVLSNITIPVGDTEVGLILMTFKVTLPEDAVIQLNDHETDFGWFAPEEAARHLEVKYPKEFTEQIANK